MLSPNSFFLHSALDVVKLKNLALPGSGVDPTLAAEAQALLSDGHQVNLDAFLSVGADGLENYVGLQLQGHLPAAGSVGQVRA